LNSKLKLIWDFRGSNTLQVAKHHAIHLEEFAKSEKLNFHDVGFTQISNLYSIAFIIVDKTNMPVYRDTLKPHRGEVA